MVEVTAYSGWQCLGSRHVGPPTPIFWGTDLSGPQRRYAGEPTGLLPNARQPTCRLPNDNLLGSRQVCSRTPDSRPVGSPTTICWGADRSAPERQIADLSASLECLINVPVRVFISRKMPPYTGLIWHYTFI